MQARDNILELILPKAVYDFFELKSYEVIDNKINIYLDELPNLPEKYKSERCISKGFTDAKIVQDYPLRDKAVYLHVRRRKWLMESSGKVVTNKYDYVAKGTLISEEFAIFLKEVFGY